MSYKIVRRFFNGSKRRTIASGLSEEQAQIWCSNPETSSSTCTKAANKRRTKLHGPWFEGYEKE